MADRPLPAELQALVEPLTDALAKLAVSVQPDQREAWTTVVTYVAITQRVLAKTNPSKIRDAARTVQIQSLMPPVVLRLDAQDQLSSTCGYLRTVQRRGQPSRRRDD